MTNIEFKRFSRPDILGAISCKHLVRFFDRLSVGLDPKYFPSSNTIPGGADYFANWLANLKSPERLPAPLVEAILAIEELAAPENRARLQAAVALAPPELYLNPTSLPECLALQIWLMAPYKRLHADAEIPAARSSPQAHPAGEESKVKDTGVAEATWVPASGEPADASNSDGGRPTGEPATNPAVPLTNPMGNEPSVSAASSAPQPSTSEPSTNTNTYHCYKGKIGRLGHEVHEAINLMMHDGVPYKTIIERLGEAGKGLKPYHFTRWRKGAHQEWHKEKERQHRTQAKQQFAVDALREKDASKLHEAALQIAAGQLSEFLADFDPAVLLEKLQTDPLNFVRLLNTLSKLSESGIKCEAHRIEMAERQVKLDKEKSPKKLGLSDETRRYIEREFHLFPVDDDLRANK